MTRISTRFVCGECGAESPRWMGRCSDCGAWNTVHEEAATSRRSSVRTVPIMAQTAPQSLTELAHTDPSRLTTGVGEIDRVFGGGLVPGGVTLIGGDPGIGKSTLLTLAADRIAAQAGPDGSSLYISGEESAVQIALRGRRMGCTCERLLVVHETDLAASLQYIASIKPSFVVIDSIQTVHDSALESAPGTVSQVRGAAAAYIACAKGTGIPIALVGHVTKEGSLAGPRVLEHLVDSVFYFEGDSRHAYRILRAVKNRYGSTDEIGIFEMTDGGLQGVENPSGAMLAERSSETTGSAVVATMEGTRPLLVEVQSLVTRSHLPTPRRTSNGFDINRLHMLLAVLEKRCGLKLGEQDVYVNVAGGIRLVEPAADLAVALAIASSFREQAVDPTIVAVGELGLGGEVRAVPHLQRRLREAARMGFGCIITGLKQLDRAAEPAVTVYRTATVTEAIRRALMPNVRLG